MTELRRKLRKLRPSNRRHLEPPTRRHEIPTHSQQPIAATVRRPPLAPVRLEDAADGVEVAAPHGGRAYLIKHAVAELDAAYHGLAGDFLVQFEREESNLRRLLHATGASEVAQPHDLVFMDLETTGLSATPLFLIGTMTWEQGGFVVSQYLARNYAEEAAAISLFGMAAAGKRALVSFNGKSFDMPYLQTRAAATGVHFEADFAHCDLLHEARRAWGRSLPNCQLQTLEAHICGRPRHDDIPGSEIPEAYHEFVRTGNAAQIVTILQHNVLDLVTLAELMLKLPAR